jgi:hypothetical protein
MCNIKRVFFPPDIMALVTGGPAASAAVQSATERRITQTADPITTPHADASLGASNVIAR